VRRREYNAGIGNSDYRSESKSHLLAKRFQLSPKKYGKKASAFDRLIKSRIHLCWDPLIRVDLRRVAWCLTETTRRDVSVVTGDACELSMSLTLAATLVAGPSCRYDEKPVS
jgi:hypothetical protein